MSLKKIFLTSENELGWGGLEEIKPVGWLLQFLGKGRFGLAKQYRLRKGIMLRAV